MISGREAEHGSLVIRSLPDHLESVALIHADLIAVAAKDALLTHAQLHAQADKAAGVVKTALLTSGADDDGARVAILVEHGAASLVASIGVLKTGAAVVPLDPGWPNEHLEWVLTTCECEVLITSASLCHRAERLDKKLSIITPDDWARAVPWHRQHSIMPDSPAFLLTTSGSSGQPKMVIELHQNVVHEALRLHPSISLTHRDRQTVLRANCAGAISDTYTALLAGASLLPFDPLGESYNSFRCWLRERKPTVWRSAPSLFRAFLANIFVPELRVVFLCGEPLYGSDLRLFRRATSPECILINCYGTTETATATVAIYPHACNAVEGTLSIGNPVADVDVTLLSENGVIINGEGIGQLAVWSPYLCGGYLGGTVQDNSRFDVDEAGNRYYATGDLGQRLVDGTLVCLGRIASDNSLPVADMADIAVSTVCPISAKSRLTWNGKSTAAVVKPMPYTDLADNIATVWALVFEQEFVGRHDNFFELGGTSLLAVQCCIALERQLQAKITPALLLQVPTPVKLARRIVQSGAMLSSTVLVPMQTHGSKSPLYLLHGWMGDVYEWAELSRAIQADRPIYGIQALRAADGSPVHQSCEEMADHYAKEILKVQATGPYHLCGYSSGGRLVWALAERLRERGATPGLLAIIETGKASDLPWRGHTFIKVVQLLRLPGRLANKIFSKAQGNSRASTRSNDYATMIEQYQLPRLDCDIDLFVGDSAKKNLLRHVWSHLTTGNVVVRPIKGGHYTMLRQPNVKTLANALADAIQSMR